MIDDNSVSVVDTGKGISEEKLQRLFVPWKNENENRRSGFGVGLSIVKRLCDQLGWQIKVDSHKSVGTTVTIKLADSSPT